MLSLGVICVRNQQVAALLGEHSQEMDRVAREANELAVFLRAQGCGPETGAPECLHELGIER